MKSSKKIQNEAFKYKFFLPRIKQTENAESQETSCQKDFQSETYN